MMIFLGCEKIIRHQNRPVGVCIAQKGRQRHGGMPAAGGSAAKGDKRFIIIIR